MLLGFIEEWAKYIGHFHPLIVHLPIGILIVAFIMELLVWKKQLVVLNHAITLCLLLGCASAVLSCLLGWFLSLEGGYEESTLQLHQWMGISVAIVGGICWLIKRRQNLSVKANKFYRALIISLLLLLTITGHFGGNMTHGEDYLTAGLPQPVAGWMGISQQKDTATIVKKKITDIREAIVYEDLVTPILSDKCYSCHSSRKVKGGLRMDTEPLLLKGGKHGVVLLPGNAAGSELIKRLLLPMDDDKRMPPKDQPAITKEELALLQWWIKTGADTKKKVKELAPDAATMTVLNTFSGESGTGHDTLSHIPLSKVFDVNLPAPDQAAIDELTRLGVLVSPVAKNKAFLELSCINYPAFSNAQAALLTKLAGNIVWLRLDNTQITDDALTSIAALKNLVRLNLANTRISSTGLAQLKALTHLEYINLIATKVDDTGLPTLAGIASLQQVYCWQSLITANGIASFRKNRPGVQLIGGEETHK
jgi:uncharacterized membrane protein